MNTKILFLSLISGLSTVLGCLILLISKKYKDKVLSFSFGVASSVMFIISVLELIPEALSYMINDLSIPILFIVSLIIMVSGGVIVNLLDKYSNSDNELYNVGWLCMLSILIHNIPEGLAVGVAFGSVFYGLDGTSVTSACILALGIGLQNFPEGTAVSVPLRRDGMSRKKAFFYGQLSGIVEPIGAILTLLLAAYVIPILPYLLAFSAGSMMYVVVEELIPESAAGKHSNIGTIGFAIGFSIMMVLDVVLG